MYDEQATTTSFCYMIAKMNKNTNKLTTPMIEFFIIMTYTIILMDKAYDASDIDNNNIFKI